MSNTIELIRRGQCGDSVARTELVESNMGLIWSVARRFIGRGVEPDDLFQLGCIGFLKAIDGFDVEFGTQFSTYAVPKIAGEIRRFLRDDGTVKVSRSIKERATTIKNSNSYLMQQLGREPSIEELSSFTGFSAEEIAIAENATAAVESIQQESGSEGFRLEHILSDSASEDVILERLNLIHAIEKLSEKEATVIRLRYFHGLTQERISKVLSVSQVQVSRIEKKAISRLKELMT